MTAEAQSMERLLALPTALGEPESLPSARAESWRWSGLNQSLPAQPFAPATQPAPGAPAPGARPPSGTILLRDGFLDETATNAAIPGLTLATKEAGAREEAGPWEEGAPEEAWQEPPRKGEESPFPALAARFASERLRLAVPEGTEAEGTQRLCWLGTGAHTATHSQLAVTLGAGASLNLILASQAADKNNAARLLNTHARFSLAPKARLRLLILEEEGAESFRTARWSLQLAPEAQAEVLLIAGGARFQRLELEAALLGPGAAFHARGLQAVAAGRRSEAVLRIHHQSGETRSSARFRAAAAARAEHIFQGRVAIPPGASGSDAAMESKSLLLDGTARSRNKPELEIFHDDVACSHGVAVSGLDETALFYLRSRGLALEAARRLAVAAFLREATQDWPAGMSASGEGSEGSEDSKGSKGSDGRGDTGGDSTTDASRNLSSEAAAAFTRNVESLL